MGQSDELPHRLLVRHLFGSLRDHRGLVCTARRARPDEGPVGGIEPACLLARPRRSGPRGLHPLEWLLRSLDRCAPGTASCAAASATVGAPICRARLRYLICPKSFGTVVWVPSAPPLCVSAVCHAIVQPKRWFGIRAEDSPLDRLGHEALYIEHSGWII